MASRTANITSTDAVQALKEALHQFDFDVNDALVMLELECRRPVDWIENDRSLYWPREVRKASDAVSEARIVLERCELTSDADNRRSCYDEKKALEKAKRRMRLAEEKVQAVQRWRGKIRKEVEEFLVQIAKMKRYLESDLPRAMAALERMSESLQRYVQRTASMTADAGSSTSAAEPSTVAADVPHGAAE